MASIKAFIVGLPDGRQVTYKTLTSDEVQGFLEFRRQIPLESTHTMIYDGMALPSAEEMVERLQTQETESFTLNIGAFHGERIVGHLNIRRLREGHPWVAHLAQFGMMVRKDYWGLGIGQKLLEAQESHARAQGITRIEAMVRVKNERGLKLYSRYGFRVEGVRKQAAYIEGEFQDEYFIAKLLNDPVADWKPPVLHTDRLILRPLGLADAPSIFAYAQNANVCRHTLWEAHRSLTDSLSYIKDYAFNYYSQGVPEPFGVALKDKPELVIGTVGCFWTSKSARAMELAYALSEEHWGKGLVAEASKAVVDYAFKEFGLKRIQARCKTENKASARVMEKIGMKFEGTLKSSLFHREKFWDMHHYAILKGDE